MSSIFPPESEVLTPHNTLGIPPIAKSKAGCSEKDAFHYRSELKSQSEFAQLPGSGVPDDDCGSPKGMHCSKCGNAFWSKRNCMKRECPDCSELWAAKEGRIASKRLSWGAKLHRKRLFDAGERRQPRLVHCVVSIIDDIENIDDIRRLAVQIAKSHGLLGGSRFLMTRRDGEHGGE